jgi:MFS family permease
MGVGIGEAVINPCAFSMIADYFPRERLSSALSVYMMGIQLGAGLALIIGGMVVHAITNMPPIEIAGFGPIAPWRLVFVVVGVPGLLIAIVLATVKEPARRQGGSAQFATTTNVPLGAAVDEVLQRWQSLLGLSLMIACQALSNYALLGWAPIFFERVHAWPRNQTGIVLGLAVICSGCIGLYIGGKLADRWQREGVADATLRVGRIGLIGVGVLLPIAMVLPVASWTVALIAVGVLFVGLPIGCCYAGVQFICPNPIRALASAVVILIVNLIGLGVGSFLPGFFTDHLFGAERMVGHSIALTIALSSVTGIVITSLTLRPYRQHYAAVQLARP